jgi:cytochrome c-type protein NapC
MDDNCLVCHQDLYKNVKSEPISEIGKLCHDAYLGKNGETGSRCAGCHQNLAHLPEFDRRYLVNAKFATKFSLEKENK